MEDDEIEDDGQAARASLPAGPGAGPVKKYIGDGTHSIIQFPSRPSAENDLNIPYRACTGRERVEFEKRHEQRLREEAKARGEPFVRPLDWDLEDKDYWDWTAGYDGP